MNTQHLQLITITLENRETRLTSLTSIHHKCDTFCAVLSYDKRCEVHLTSIGLFFLPTLLVCSFSGCGNALLTGGLKWDNWTKRGVKHLASGPIPAHQRVQSSSWDDLAPYLSTGGRTLFFLLQST